MARQGPLIHAVLSQPLTGSSPLFAGDRDFVLTAVASASTPYGLFLPPCRGGQSTGSELHVAVSTPYGLLLPCCLTYPVRVKGSVEMSQPLTGSSDLFAREIHASRIGRT